jgi:hypothetical protein
VLKTIFSALAIPFPDVIDAENALSKMTSAVLDHAEPSAAW